MRAAACVPHPAFLSQPSERREGGRSPRPNPARLSSRRDHPGERTRTPRPSRVHLPVCVVCTPAPSLSPQPPGPPRLAQVVQTPPSSGAPCRAEEPRPPRRRTQGGERAPAREEAGSVPDGAAASEPGRSGEGAAGQEPGSAAAAPGAGTHVELPRGARGQRQVSAAGPSWVRAPLSGCRRCPPPSQRLSFPRSSRHGLGARASWAT